MKQAAPDLGEVQVSQDQVEPKQQRNPAVSLRKILVGGSTALGFASLFERGLGFIAGVLAARIGQASVFGAYSVALSTAGTVAAYAGAGIGTTAIRFSGQYPREGKGYRGFLRAIIALSILSALLAAGLMLVGADFLARVALHNESLTPTLRLAALSAAAFILFESCRGLLIGQHKFSALLLLSVIFGVGLLVVLPITANVGSGAMVQGQAGVALVAVLVCALFARQLGIGPVASRADDEAPGPGLRSLFTFGIAQLGALVGVNIASWWLISLVARSDSTLMQMGTYAIANQLRGLAAIGPTILGQICYPLLTEEASREYGGPDRIVSINAFITTALTLIVAGAILIILPFALLQIYGVSYVTAEAPSALLLATAIIHMGGIPAANRMYIVALHSAAAVNAGWAVIVIGVGILVVPVAGATGAAATLFLAQLIAQLSVLFVLKRAGALPSGLLRVSVIAIAAAIALGILGYLRAYIPAHSVFFTLLLTGVLAFFLFVLGYLGLSEGWLQKMFAKGAILPIIEALWTR